MPFKKAFHNEMLFFYNEFMDNERNEEINEK